MNPKLKVPMLLLSTFLLGIAGNIPVNPFSGFAMHPSPMCAAAKSFLFGFRMPFLVTLAVIFFLTLVGPKLFCGWVCPVGAIQELIAMAADKMKIVRKKLSFTVSQTVRAGLFLFFLFFSVTALLHFTSEGQVLPLNIYDYINAFHGFELRLQPDFFANVFHFLPFLLTVVLAFKFYRPFCHYVCPIGLYTHAIEQISLFRISLKKTACNDCGICTKKSPCKAIPEIMKGAALRPDCFACNVCIECSPSKALQIGTRRISD